MQRLKEGDNTNTSQDIIWAQGPPNSHGQSNISHFRFYWKCNFPINLHDCWLVGRSGCHSFSTHAETQLSENLHKELFTQRKRLNKIGILLISSHYLHNAIKMIFSNDFHKINVPKDWFKQFPIVFPAEPCWINHDVLRKLSVDIIMVMLKWAKLNQDEQNIQCPLITFILRMIISRRKIELGKKRNKSIRKKKKGNKKLSRYLSLLILSLFIVFFIYKSLPLLCCFC